MGASGSLSSQLKSNKRKAEGITPAIRSYQTVSDVIEEDLQNGKFAEMQESYTPQIYDVSSCPQKKKKKLANFNKTSYFN